MNLDELKSRRKKFVSLALTADCGDDYWNDVDEIDKQINRRCLKMNKKDKKKMSINGVEINKKSKYVASIYNPTTGDIGIP